MKKTTLASLVINQLESKSAHIQDLRQIKKKKNILPGWDQEYLYPPPPEYAMGLNLSF